MKPNHLFTSMLALATIVVSSCSTQKIAQQSSVADDVYNSTAQAMEYTPRPVTQGSQTQQPDDYDDEYYGTSDPYYDMSYSSRINRFYYGSPWRNYYDPYFDFYAYGAYPWYGNAYAGWGNYYSPFGWNNWGYSNWGFALGYGYGSPWAYSPWGWNSYYGGGFLGGGYYGGGFYTGRTTNVPYTARPNRGNSSGYRPARSAMDGFNNGTPNRSTRASSYNGANGRTSNSVGRQTNPSGNTMNRPSRGAVSRPTRTSPPPTRTESRPTYTPPTPPPSSSGSSGSSSGGRGGSGGGGRPTRGGGR